MREAAAIRRRLDACLSDPAWLPHRVLDEGRVLRMVQLSRAEQRERPFLDRRRVGEDRDFVDLSVSQIRVAQRPPATGPHFIFHSAYCRSTLLSRALQVDGVSTVLKEPQALADLAAMLPKSGWPQEQRLALDVVIDLMGRTELPHEQLLIKPSNCANLLIEHIMELRPDSRILLMYAPLPAFLLSVCRRRRWSRVRRFATAYRLFPQFETEGTRDLLLLTDLQAAAFLWLQQQAQFARLVRDFPPARVATLRADVFCAEPARTLRAAAAHFGLRVMDEQIAQITTGPVFSRDSKSPDQRFDERILKRDEALAKLAFGPEIDTALDWATAVAAQAAVPQDLGSPLA
jgi:hypothetical protein